MITIDKEKLRAARVNLDAHRWTLSTDSIVEPHLEFLSDLCAKIFVALDYEGAVLIQQQEGGKDGEAVSYSG